MTNRATRAQRFHQKLDYSDVLLGQVTDNDHENANTKFENAHLEGCVFHLVGAFEVILLGVNDAYTCMDDQAVTLKRVKKKLDADNKQSAAFELLRNAKSSSDHLELLFALRNQCTHRAYLGKTVMLGSDRKQENIPFDPSTGREQTVFPGLGFHSLIKLFRSKLVDLSKECESKDSAFKQHFHRNVSSGS